MARKVMFTDLPVSRRREIVESLRDEFEAADRADEPLFARQLAQLDQDADDEDMALAAADLTVKEEGQPPPASTHQSSWPRQVTLDGATVTLERQRDHGETRLVARAEFTDALRTRVSVRLRGNEIGALTPEKPQADLGRLRDFLSDKNKPTSALTPELTFGVA